MFAIRFLTPKGLEGPDDTAQQRVTELNLLREVAPSCAFSFPELHDAVRSSLQWISQAISWGDVEAARQELADVIAALDVPQQPSADVR